MDPIVGIQFATFINNYFQKFESSFLLGISYYQTIVPQITPWIPRKRKISLLVQKSSNSLDGRGEEGGEVQA